VAFRTIAVHLDFENILKLGNQVFLAGKHYYFFEIDEKNTLAFFEWEGAQSVEKKHHGVPFKGPINQAPNGGGSQDIVLLLRG
jgi:hypothetical protein